MRTRWRWNVQISVQGSSQRQGIVVADVPWIGLLDRSALTTVLNNP